MKISFKRTGQVYLNAGIIGLLTYLRKRWQDEEGSRYGLEADELWWNSDEPIKDLEDVYYAMGEDYYDTSTPDALANPENFYYRPESDDFVAFPKKKTYGFGALLTNDAAGKTRNEAALVRRKAIKPEQTDLLHMAKRYEAHFADKGLKLGEQLYINEPYIKITRLQLNEDDLATGKLQCPVTGEGFKKLQDATNVSPTTSGLSNFLSGLSGKSDKIGWKALYLVRFAPVLAMYRYAGGLDSLYCYFYDAPKLTELDSLYERIGRNIYLNAVQKLEVRHLSNMQLAKFSLGGQKEASLSEKDFVHPHETLFLLIYTLQRLYLNETDERGLVTDEYPLDHFNLYLLRADKFAGTTRPNRFVAFNHFAYTLRLLDAAQRAGIDWGQVLASLKTNENRAAKDAKYATERRMRDQLLERLMTGQSILPELASVFSNAYRQLTSNESAGFKNWKQLTKLLEFNEYGPLKNHVNMEPALQQIAYKLGTQIGLNILNADTEGSKKERAKASRKYIIGMEKSRTGDEFLEAVTRIMRRYNFTINKELVSEGFSDEHFRRIKLLTVIGAMNVLNYELSNNKNQDKPA